MDGIKSKGFKYFFTLITGIIIGMLAGAVGMGTLISYRLDEYIERINYLETQVQDKDIRLEKLEESINKSKFILKSIDIIFSYDEEEIDETTLEKVIKQKYKGIIGKEVKNIDVDMVTEVIDKRIMRLDKEEYKLKVKKLVLSEELMIWVEIEKLD
ncbi:hypothetical protein [Caldisalinibacter kiritimatiensis]|uniref:Sporulation membrane protein YtrI C-terminal domain-containing protein n=1 Tax=Caldisalinibacter kiritimatiensis TaxID=1304284 RepID=R1AX15_9FIRM|nr:hypothetical protein [Caldisalinibacter kiritimatiensis]EOD01748.1 hypothetical protein L21TH_0174 [Caldisalinibacter kiritimatiensis]